MNKSEQERRRRNNDVVRRMRAGEPLTNFSSENSFFPPRPLIKKDKKTIQKLFLLKDPKDG